MNITLFNNTSGTNVLNKSITQLSGGIVGTVKDESNVVDPTIIMSKDVTTLYPNFNYFYIHDFDRYYYVTDKTIEHGRTVITGHCDPLMSFADEIKNLTIIAERASNNYDLYQVDNDVSLDNYRIIATKAFQNGFNEGHFYVLSCCG